MRKIDKAQPLPHRAAIYARVSKPEQARAEDVSIDTQIDGCKRWAAEHAFPLVDKDLIFWDTHTGEELYERPALTRLREAAKARQFSTVIVWTVDRLARDPIHSGVILMELDRLGVKVEFANDAIDDTPEGHLVRFVKAYAAKIENATRVERFQRARRERARRGIPIFGGRPMYGYKWNADKTAYLIDEPKAAIVRRMFQEAASGKSLRKIAQGLTDDGIPTPTGRSHQWDQSVIQVMLSQPAYWGKHAAFRTRKEKYKPEERPYYKTRARRLAADEEHQIPIPADVVPPIISEELAMIVAERLRMNKLLSPRNTHHPEQSLLQGGFAKCGYCGASLAVLRHKDRGNPYPLYVCRKRVRLSRGCESYSISAYRLDKAVWQFVCQVFKNPEIIAQEVENMRGKKDLGKDEIESIQRNIVAKERIIANLLRIAGQNDDPDADAQLAQDIALHSSEKRRLEESLVATKAHFAKMRAQQDDLTALLEWCASIGEHADDLSYDEKRHVLAAIGLEVLVKRQDADKRAEIRLKLPTRTVPMVELEKYAVFSVVNSTGFITT